jgi:hypothetical protein
LYRTLRLWNASGCTERRDSSDYIQIEAAVFAVLETGKSPLIQVIRPENRDLQPVHLAKIHGSFKSIYLVVPDILVPFQID